MMKQHLSLQEANFRANCGLGASQGRKEQVGPQDVCRRSAESGGAQHECLRRRARPEMQHKVEHVYRRRPSTNSSRKAAQQTLGIGSWSFTRILTTALTDCTLRHPCLRRSVPGAALSEVSLLECANRASANDDESSGFEVDVRALDGVVLILVQAPQRTYQSDCDGHQERVQGVPPDRP